MSRTLATMITARRPLPELRCLWTLVLMVVVMSACSSEAPPLPELPDPDEMEQGIDYHYELYAHCGVDKLIFTIDGSDWELEVALWDGVGDPPRELSDAYEESSQSIDGTLRWVDADSVTFTVEESGMVLRYRRLETSTAGCD